MKCPICKRNAFIELKSSPDTWNGKDGYSIKECRACKYKVMDRTSDGRFIGVLKVLNPPKLQKGEGME